MSYAGEQGQDVEEEGPTQPIVKSGFAKDLALATCVGHRLNLLPCVFILRAWGPGSGDIQIGMIAAGPRAASRAVAGRQGTTRL